jgi:SNF2-related domain
MMSTVDNNTDNNNIQKMKDKDKLKKCAMTTNDQENEIPNPRRRPTNQKRSSPKTDSDDDDELHPFMRQSQQGGVKKSKTAVAVAGVAAVTLSKDKCRPKNSKKTRPMDDSQTEWLPNLTRDEKQAVLGEIANPFDQNLQIVLWEIDCNYTLLEHQFKGVRALAGVPDDFPGPLMLKTKIEDLDQAISDWTYKVLRTAKPRRPNVVDRGILMADVMGLGKTVQAVAACGLRNAMANAKGEPPLPTLIVSPNNAVVAQWHDTLIKAGMLFSNPIFFLSTALTLTFLQTYLLTCFLACFPYHH